jgi:SHS2 domain-containing protein
MGWQAIDHMGDMGIRVTAPDLPSLFREGALALVDITGAGSQEGGEAREVSVRGLDQVDLLVRWLQEILYLLMVKDLRVRGIEILSLTETDARAQVLGSCLKTPLKREIKAVTYHGLDIIHRGDSYEVSIILDL